MARLFGGIEAYFQERWEYVIFLGRHALSRPLNSSVDHQIILALELGNPSLSLYKKFKQSYHTRHYSGLGEMKVLDFTCDCHIRHHEQSFELNG